MKFKSFSADSQANIDKAVNDWVAQQNPPIAVRLSDTKMQMVTLGGRKVAVVTVGIWYDQGPSN